MSRFHHGGLSVLQFVICELMFPHYVRVLGHKYETVLFMFPYVLFSRSQRSSEEPVLRASVHRYVSIVLHRLASWHYPDCKEDYLVIPLSFSVIPSFISEIEMNRNCVRGFFVFHS